MELRKLRDKATEAFTKGKFAKAAELYADYCQKDPKDIQARLRMGDAWAKAGERPKAIAAYKAAAEAFAREGFLPRAIAASKLILELDPSHQGIQQMLAELYARKGGAPAARSRSAPKNEVVTARSKHAPIELDEDDAKKASPSQKRGSELPEDDAPKAAPSSKRAIELPEFDQSRGTEVGPTGGEGPASDSEPATPKGPALLLPEEDSGLPPELEVFATQPIAPPPQEIVLEVETVEAEVVVATPAQDAPPAPELPAAANTSSPPGLRRRPSQPAPAELSADAAEDTEPVLLTSLKPAPKPAAGPVAVPVIEVEQVTVAAPERNVVATDGAGGLRPTGRFFIPGTEEAAAVVSSNSSSDAGATDLERAFSRFDELSLEDAPISQIARMPEPSVALAQAAVPPPPAIEAAPPPAAAVTQAQAPRLPSFTELELEGDSLLHAVEVAALAGQTQRGESDQVEEEEEVFSITAEVGSDQPDPDALPRIPLFSDLPPDAFIELFERCPLRRFGMGERIIEQGSVGDAFYVVCEGAVRVMRRDADEERELASLKEGAFFGEMALLSGAARSASVDSDSEDTQLLEISAPVLAQLSHRYPTVAQALKKFCRSRMLNNVMNTSALFRPFGKDDRKKLISKFRARDAKKGETLIREGADTDGLYIVLSGEVEVVRGGHTLARLHEGELFGEMSLLKKTVASADVVTTRRTSLLRLPRSDFDALILTHPQVLILISELTDDRQRQNEAVLAGTAELGDEGLLLV